MDTTPVSDPDPSGPLADQTVPMDADPVTRDPGDSGWHSLADRCADVARSWRRSTTDRWVGGVCGGLALRLRVPTVLVRIVFVIGGLFGVGFLAYVLACVLVPTERGDRILGRSSFGDLVAVGALFISALIVLNQVRALNVTASLARLFPWLLVIGGLMLVLRRYEPTSTITSSTTPTTGFATAPTTGLPEGTHPESSLAVDPRAVIPASARPVRSPRAPRPHRFLGPLTLAAAAVVCSVLAVIRFSGVEAISPGVIAGACLGVLSVGLITSARFGRARGLILIAAPLGALLLLPLMADVRLTAIGAPHRITALQASDLPENIEATAGSSAMNLFSLHLNEDRTVQTNQIAGRIELVLPAEVRTRVVAHIGFGDVDLFQPMLSRAARLSTPLPPEWSSAELAPKSGEVVTPASLKALFGELFDINSSGLDRVGLLGQMPDGDNGRSRSFDRTFGPPEGPVLTVHVVLGTGTLAIDDPHWAGPMPEIQPPSQVCAEGGGPRGRVLPCASVPADRQVAVCMRGAAEVIDCRELSNGDLGVVACRNQVGEYTACDVLKITPVGVAPTVRTANTIAPVTPQGSSTSPADSTAPTTTMPTNTIPPIVAPSAAVQPATAVQR